jgi:hypothetical protein
LKPLELVQYLGSAAQGLGFFHVEVQEEANRGGGGYLKFIDNCDVLTVVEGEIETEEIVENLLNLFDPKWHWQLRKMDDYMYLVRFLPHKQISATLISDTTYFKLEFWLHWRHGMEM